MAIANGLYELRSMLLTKMCADVAGGSAVRGANVQLYSSNDSNAQKFRVLEETSAHWSLQNANSRMYVDVAGGTAKNGQNVQQYTDNDSRAQRWNIIDSGETVAIDGYTCSVVTIGSYVTTDGTAYAMDVRGAMSTNKTNIQIYSANGTLAQQFALMPTTLLDKGIPAPTGLGWAASVGGSMATTHVGHSTAAMYVGWQCPSTWVPDATRGFERRVRTRTMDAETSTWGAWGAWSQWADVSPTMSGRLCFDTNAIDPHFSPSSVKALDVQVQVRGKTSTKHGPSASATLRNVVSPTATLTSAGASADGFLVDVTSDYAPATYAIQSLDMGGTELLAKEVKAEILSTGSAVRLTIPWDRLLGLNIPAEGTTATARYTRSTDLMADMDGGATRTATLALSYGTAPSTAPTITASDGLTLLVEHSAGIVGAWTSDGRGVYPTEDGARVVYPFGQPFDLLVALGNGKLWHAAMPAQSGIMPCHAWNWSDGYLLLEHVTGRMVTSRDMKAIAETMELDARPWQTVTFADTLEGQLKASGVLWDGSECTAEDVVALMRAHNATYRAPSGEVMHVAVTDASYETDSSLTEVDVSMTQVTR
jgi:hypothetical protein